MTASSADQKLVEKLARPELLTLQGYSSARMEAGLAPIILNANENPYPPEIGPADWQLNRYPPPQPANIVQLLADLYGVTSEQLLVTRGSDEGIDLLVRAFCTAGQDTVVYCPPTFGMYKVAAQVQNAKLVSVPLQGNDWSLDNEQIIAARPKLVFLCSPNNPTGHVVDTQQINELCQQLADSALVIVDEAYIEFADADGQSQQIASIPNLVVLRTLSKAWGMAGLRCGSVLASPAIIQLLRKIMAPYPLPISTIELVEQALQDQHRGKTQQTIRQLREARQQLQQLFARLPYVQQCWPSQGNFLLLRVEDAEALIMTAVQAGILLRNQSSQPGLHNCVRVSVGSSAENRQLQEFMESFGEKLA